MAPIRGRLNRAGRRFVPAPVQEDGTLEVLGRLEAQLTEVFNHALESDRALRGYDSEPGVVARVVSLQAQVTSLATTVQQDHKTLEDVVRYQKDYPSLFWMARFQTSKFIGYVAGIIIMGLALPLIGTKFLALILHALKVPDPLIDFYLGGS